jgi:UDP-N-acetylmuramoyl-tripeptide--D-alanyl-D-alanine ligase
MLILLFLLAATCYGFGAAPGLLYDVHMLQLNSYRNERYWRWLRLDKTRFLHWGPPFTLPPLLLWPIAPTLAVPLWSAAFAALFVLRDKTPSKKKLAITRRVQRLLAVYAGLSAAVAFALWRLAASLDFAPGFVALASLSILATFSPVVLSLANWLAAPMEKGIARHYYNDAKAMLERHGRLKVIGITGSYGKTSTKFILQQCLSVRYNALATPESFNTTLGIVRTARTLLRPIHDIFVAEMGARQPGDIREICELARPRIGVITAIGEQHLETFGDVSTVARTKLELFAALKPGDLAFYNQDDPILNSASKPAAPRYVTYAIDAEDADYRAADVQPSARGTEFTVLAPGGASARFRTRLLGRHNVYNILAALAVSAELGIPLADLAVPVAALKPAPHRLEARKTAGGVTILDDAYNSNPMGAKSALEVLASMEGERKILITPGMVELGERERELNKAFGAQAATACDYAVLVGPKRTMPIREGLLEAGFPAERIYVAADLQDGQKHLDAMLRAGDVVLYENDLPDNYNEAKV